MVFLLHDELATNNNNNNYFITLFLTEQIITIKKMRL